MNKLQRYARAGTSAISSASSIEHVLREAVACNLCGANDTAVKFTISERAGRSASIWWNGREHKIAGPETIVQCRRCGLVYVNPRLAGLAGLSAYSVDQELAYFGKTRAVRLHAYATLLQNVPSWSGTQPESLLDVGCGDGAMLEAARRSNIRAQGTEMSSTLIDLVRERMGPDAVMSGDVNQAPVAHFEIVTLINVIEHVRDPSELLLKIHRTLRPNGLLLIHTPNLGGMPARVRGGQWHQISPYGHFYYFTPRTLTKMLQRSGFEPCLRFELFTSLGWKAMLQQLGNHLGLHVGNGLGVVARRMNLD